MDRLRAASTRVAEPGIGSHVFGLDLVRAIAICTVLHQHGWFFFDHLVHWDLWHAPMFIDGVTLFFVLSGFLIGRILFISLAAGRLNGMADLLHFWKRRWWRTLPAYFAVLLILIVIAALTGYSMPPWLWRYFLFLQNLAWPHPGFFGEAWSLCVEEWFYLLLPITLVIAARARPQWRNRIILCIIVGFIAGPLVLKHWRYMQGMGLDRIDRDLQMIVLFRLDNLMIGVAGAWAAVHMPTFWKRVSMPGLLIGIGLLIMIKLKGILVGHSLWFEAMALQNLQSLAVLACMPWLANWQPRSSMLTRIIAFVAAISYSMYLLNFAVVQLNIMPLLPELMNGLVQVSWRHSLIPLVVFWGTTLALATTLHFAFEKPMTTMRDRSRAKVNSGA